MSGVRMFRFGVACHEPMPRQAWHRLARKAEELGYSTLLTGDHLGRPSSLARVLAAADATATLRVGTFVLNNDFYHPLRLAQEAATVDEFTGGRFELGLGAGWAKPEYELLGLAYQAPPERAARLDSAIDTMQRAWAGKIGLGAGGETVPAVPRPAQAPHPPLLIGGQSDAVLTVAARRADIIGFTGVRLHNSSFGGSFRPAGVSAAAIAKRVGFVRAAAGDRFARLEFNVQVDAAIITDDGPAVIDKVATLRGVEPAVVAGSPFALIGSRCQLADKLDALRQQIGISYYVVSHKVLDSFAPVVAELAGR